LRIHYSTDAEKDDAWMLRHSAMYGGVESPKWRREMEIDYSAVQGQPVYPMLCSEHIRHRDIRGWSVYRVIDHGIRHPTVCLWVAVSPAGDRHVFREYYRTGATIPTNCSEILRLSLESVVDTYIDPSTRQRLPLGNKDNQPVSIVSMYNDGLKVVCRYADNSAVGYDTTKNGLLSTLSRSVLSKGVVDTTNWFSKTYFGQYGLPTYELEQLASKQSLTFDPGCVRAFREMRNLRYAEVAGDATAKAQPEKVLDFEDDGADCVRYAMQSRLIYQNVVRAQAGSPYWEKEQKRLRTYARKINRTVV
jgi:hypothetical protein